jgi:hypothetical protein
MCPTNRQKRTTIVFGTRYFWAAGLVAVFVAAQSATAIEADQTPEELLKSRGLTKSGSVYTLDQEAEFLKKIANVQPLYRQVRELYDKLVVIAQKQYAYDEIDNQYNVATEQLRNVQAEQDAFPSTSNNVLKQQWAELLEMERQLRIQRNALNRELNLRYKNLASNREKETLTADFQKQRENFLKETKEPRALAEKIKEKYGELSKDEAVTKAIAAVNAATKTRANLGPTAEFRKKSAQLKSAEAELSPQNFVRKAAGKKAQRPQAERKTKDAPKGKRASPSDSGKTGASSG